MSAHRHLWVDPGRIPKLILNFLVAIDLLRFLFILDLHHFFILLWGHIPAYTSIVSSLWRGPAFSSFMGKGVAK